MHLLPSTFGYGLGWEVRLPETSYFTTDPVQRSGYVSHTGGAIGATSVLLAVPPTGFWRAGDRNDGCVRDVGGPEHEGLCVSVLSNLQSSVSIRLIALRLARIFLDEISGVENEDADITTELSSVTAKQQ